MNQPPQTATATYCATLVDQLYAEGLRRACVAPGSRSTPMALALVDHGGIKVAVFHDERSAAFAALGYGMATGQPALTLCTSGTAAAHFFAAVIEADLSAIPIIVCTADRPPELWGRGAPQTIDQTNLYGGRVRAFIEPGPPDPSGFAQWRSVARSVWLASLGSTPGPVHLNVSFRDPLTGAASELPPALGEHGMESGDRPGPPETEASTSAPPDPVMLNRVATAVRSARGVIIAGRSETRAEDVLELAERLGWPVISDHRSGCRIQHDLVLSRFDSLLRCPSFAHAAIPDVVLRVGEIVSSKATSQWLSHIAEAGTDIFSSRPYGRLIDPEAIATETFAEHGFIAALCAAVPAEFDGDRGWARRWTDADRLAGETIDTAIADAAVPNEIGLARAAIDAVPDGGALVLSSSMPVRDVEWFGQNRAGIEVYSNRGANGIDGVVATAVGVALTGRPTLCLIGDVAFLHDSSTLIGLHERPIDLTILVIDNDGGGIFSFLPQQQLLAEDRYEFLFGTPHGTDIAAMCAAHSIPCALFGQMELGPSGLRVVIARTDRASNQALHDRLHARVAGALNGSS